MSKYVVDDNKNFERAFNQEEVLGILQQAIDDGTLENIDPNSAVASKLRSLLTGKTYNLEYVTTAIYNQLVAEGRDDPNTIYYLIDDPTPTAIRTAIKDINERLDALGFKTGVVTVSSGNGTITSQSLIKQGKIAILNLTYTGKINELQLPIDFYPKQDTKILLAREAKRYYDLIVYNEFSEFDKKGDLIPYGAIAKEILVKRDGTISLTASGLNIGVSLGSAHMAQGYFIQNASDTAELSEGHICGGWQLI